LGAAPSTRAALSTFSDFVTAAAAAAAAAFTWLFFPISASPHLRVFLFLCAESITKKRSLDAPNAPDNLASAPELFSYKGPGGGGQGLTKV
jgi:hypothetical protein